MPLVKDHGIDQGGSMNLPRKFANGPGQDLEIAVFCHIANAMARAQGNLRFVVHAENQDAEAGPFILHAANQVTTTPASDYCEAWRGRCWANAFRGSRSLDFEPMLVRPVPILRA